MEKKPGLIDEISEKLFNEFQRAVALHPDKQKRGRKPSEDDAKAISEAALEKFYQSADQEKARHKLGIIGRARVALGVQQRLLNAGYAPSVVKQVLLAMLVSVFASRR